MKLLIVQCETMWTGFTKHLKTYLEGEGHAVKITNGTPDVLGVLIDYWGPNVVLWWKVDCRIAKVLPEWTAKKGSTIFAFYNWDASCAHEKNGGREFLSHMDLHFSCNLGEEGPFIHLLPSAPFWPVLGCPDLGLDSDHPKEPYAYDLCFPMKTFYEGRRGYAHFHPLYDRRTLMNALEEAPDISCGFFGEAKSLQKDFPTSFQGFLFYDDFYQTFSRSKMVMSLHADDRPGYLNERTMCVLASGAPLLSDPIPGVLSILKHGETAIILDPEKDFLTQVRYWLDPEREDLRQKIGLAGQKLFKEKFGMDSWFRKILEKLTR